MKLKYLPRRDGREATFYHMTTEGHDEENRQYDQERTERLPWARPLIENEATPEADVRVWKERVKGEWRIHLWLHKRNYILVIAQRGSEQNRSYLPWTAFAIQYSHQQEKYEKRWKRNASK